MIDIEGHVMIRNVRYKRRLFCALLDFYSNGILEDKKCDEIVQKWIKADDETVNKRLEKVNNISIKLEFNCMCKSELTI